MVETPVLLATFARPEYARKTFDAIKKAKPKKLYFYSNKAREDNPDELERNNQVRALIKEVDWDCELKTYFREEYVDVYTSLWGAYDWILENEEEAIIFEEDCVPSLAFFDFCDQLLPKYKNDQRVWLISGNNFFEEYNPSGYDYIFTRYPYQWGWAIWRDRWQKIKRKDIPWEEMKKYELFRQLYPNKKQAKFHLNREDIIYKNLQNRPSWDFTMGFTAKSEGSFGIIPTKNLVMNIGCLGANHSGCNPLIHYRTTSTDNKYTINNHPSFVVPDYRHDQYFFKHFYYKNTMLSKRIIRKVKKLVHKFF